MFSKPLCDITLAGDLAERVFHNIRCDSFNGDETFQATLRALLLPRVGKDEIVVTRSTANFEAAAIRTAGLFAVVNASIGSFDRGCLHICSVGSSREEDRLAMFECLDDQEKGFVASFPKFMEMVDIRRFVTDVMNARFYINEETKTTVVYVDKLNMKKWHFLQVFIPRYFLWYFKEAPYTEEEKVLLMSLGNRSSSNYERLIEEAAARFDLRSYLIDEVVGGIERRSREAQLENIDRNISEARQEINHLMERYSSWLDRLDDLNVRRIGVIDIINNATDDSELVEYFKMNKSLEPLSSNDTRLEFIVKTLLDSWDPELFESMVNKDTSSLYRGYGIGIDAFKPVETRRKFFNAIFSDEPKLRIKLCGYYRLDMRGDSTSREGYHYPRSCHDRLPNPHLQKFNCLGNHRRVINDYLRKGDAVSAIEQCIASCKSLNLTEPQTFTYFFEKLFNTQENVIELPDHSSVSPEQALEWLIAQETDKEETKDAQAD